MNTISFTNPISAFSLCICLFSIFVSFSLFSPGPHLPKPNLPNCKNEQVQRNRLLHRELLHHPPFRTPHRVSANKPGGLMLDRRAALEVPSRHYRRELPRDVQSCAVADARCRSVLAGEDGESVDGLTLSVDERVGLVEGLRWRQPLEGGGRWQAGVDDLDGGVVGEGDGELVLGSRTEWTVRERVSRKRGLEYWGAERWRRVEPSRQVSHRWKYIFILGGKISAVVNAVPVPNTVFN